MSAAMLWILAGVALIIIEVLITNVVAVFFGIAAILTGLLLQFGIIESTAAQYTIFAVVSVASLVLVRGRMTHWFQGHTKDKSEEKPSFQSDIGERAAVVDDFKQGSGRVTLNGVRWNALSNEDLKAGETVWVIANEGIELTVSRTRPTA